MRQFLLPAIILVAFSCDSVDHDKREQHARLFAEPLGEIKSISCQHQGMNCANETNTSCAVIVEGAGTFLLNCSNLGCEAIGTRP